MKVWWHTVSVLVCVVLIKAEIKCMRRATGTYLASTSVDTLPGTFLRISSPKLTNSLSIVFATCSSSVLKNKRHITKLVNVKFRLHCKVIFTEKCHLLVMFIIMLSTKTGFRLFSRGKLIKLSSGPINVQENSKHLSKTRHRQTP